MPIFPDLPLASRGPNSEPLPRYQRSCRNLLRRKQVPKARRGAWRVDISWIYGDQLIDLEHILEKQL